jgi:FkbM family methyltransferase
MNFFQKIYQIYYKPKIFFPKKTYSLLGEDTIINNFFKKNNGIYVDIGCYHPLQGNNTYLLYKRGWKGLNIDINKLSIELFEIKRPEDINLKIAVSDKSEKVDYYFRRKINMLNTINKNFAFKNFPNGFKKDKIQSETLNNILDKSKYKNSKLDLINIDVEGNEFKVLKNFNFKRYLPKIICIEIHHYNKNQLKKNKIYNLLLKKNYQLIYQNKYAFIFKIGKI